MYSLDVFWKDGKTKDLVGKGKPSKVSPEDADSDAVVLVTGNNVYSGSHDQSLVVWDVQTIHKQAKGEVTVKVDLFDLGGSKQKDKGAHW